MVLLRNYASLWSRRKLSGGRPLGEFVETGAATTSSEMTEFVGEYLSILDFVQDPDLEAHGLVVDYEEVVNVEGSLPQNLMKVWELEDTNGSPSEYIQQLRKIAEACDEFDLSCEHAACRHFGLTLDLDDILFLPNLSTPNADHHRSMHYIINRDPIYIYIYIHTHTYTIYIFIYIYRRALFISIGPGPIFLCFHLRKFEGCLRKLKTTTEIGPQYTASRTFARSHSFGRNVV